MPSYRLYRLDGAGKIKSAEWIDAGSDEQALVLAHELTETGHFELWDRERFVVAVNSHK